MKKKLIVWSIATAVAATLLWAWPRYALVGILCLLGGWIGHGIVKRMGR